MIVLGGFAVRIDGVAVGAAEWRRRNVTALVELLALAPTRRLHREQVLDALWPELSVDDATPRLHKAAHFARRALGRTDAVVLAGEMVELLPDVAVRVDAATFATAAIAALDAGRDPGAIDAALDLYTGDLLPEELYSEWTVSRREELRHLYIQLLRATGRWAELLAVDPTDEAAHVALMRVQVDRGDRASALAQYERLAAVLAEHLGVEPGAEARQLRDSLQTEPALPLQRIGFCHAADGVRLAYARVGKGPVLVKAATWLTHLEYDWESAIWRHWLQTLAARFDLLRYDERGCGLSDWNTSRFDLDAWVEDLAAVVDAVGYERFPLLGISQGAAVAVAYAARYPDRVNALVLYGGYVHGPVRRARNDDERRAAELLPDLAELGWGHDEPSFRQVFTARFMPGGTRAQWDEFNELQRRSTSPANAKRFMEGFAQIDVSDAAGRVQCPTLVLHVRGDRLPPLEQGRSLAALIPGSRFVSLEGDNHLMLAEDGAWPRFVNELDTFLREVGATA